MGTFQRFRTCDGCQGTGDIPQSKTVNLPENQKVLVTLEPDTCSKCKGTGKRDIVDDLLDEINTSKKKKYLYTVVAIGGMCTGLLILLGIYYLVSIGQVSVKDSTITSILAAICFGVFVYAFVHDIWQMSKKIPLLEEKIELILHLDTKAKRDQTPEPVYVGGKLVQDVSLVTSRQDNEALLDKIEQELNVPTESAQLPDEVGMPPEDTNTLSSNAYQDHLSFWSKLGGD